MTPITPCGEDAIYDYDDAGRIVGMTCMACLCVVGSMACPCDSYGNAKKQPITPVKQSQEPKP